MLDLSVLLGEIVGNEGARSDLTLQVSFGVKLVEGLNDGIPRNLEGISKRSCGGKSTTAWQCSVKNCLPQKFRKLTVKRGIGTSV